MVNSQLRTNDVSDAAVLGAFLAVPREDFVAPEFVKVAYLDQDLPSVGAGKRKLLAPRTLGRLLQAAEPKPGERALEVGGGAGYGAAVLAALGATAILLESDAGAIEAAKACGAPVKVISGELDKGAPADGPFDIILLNGAFEVTPSALIGQLADRGRLVGLDSRQQGTCGVLILKSGRGVSERPLFDASADVLPGFARAAVFAF